MKFFVRDEDGNETELNTSIFNLKKNDIVIVKTNTQIAAQKFDKIIKQLKSYFKDNNCIGIGPDLEIGVIRKEK